VRIVRCVALRCVALLFRDGLLGKRGQKKEIKERKTKHGNSNSNSNFEDYWLRVLPVPNVDTRKPGRWGDGGCWLWLQ